MDAETLGAAIALMNKILPGVTSADAGEMLVVGADGKWAAGAATEKTISVSGHTMLVSEPTE